MTKQNELPKPLLTKKRVAEILDTSEKTVDRRIRSGELPAIRDGRIIRIRPEDLDRYISQHRFG